MVSTTTVTYGGWTCRGMLTTRVFCSWISRSTSAVAALNGAEPSLTPMHSPLGARHMPSGVRHARTTAAGSVIRGLSGQPSQAAPVYATR
ncbi:hypothetical protein [Carbonactinospora thermoautotrophica]|uniref:hypothetical protein n=1 Tax=Carbonactinospora thermoautotrophica TaxID=1469144 RepID=UPI003DA9E532